MRPGIARLACLCIAALLSVFATAAADEPLPPGATLRLGKQLAVGGLKGEVYILGVADGKLIRTLRLGKP